MFSSRPSSQISQLTQCDREHREIEVAGGLKVGEHLPAASQCDPVLRFPLFDERIRRIQLGPKSKYEAGKLFLQAGDIVCERRPGQRLPVRIRR